MRYDSITFCPWRHTVVVAFSLVGVHVVVAPAGRPLCGTAVATCAIGGATEVSAGAADDTAPKEHVLLQRAGALSRTRSAAEKKAKKTKNTNILAQVNPEDVKTHAIAVASGEKEPRVTEPESNDMDAVSSRGGSLLSLVRRRLQGAASVPNFGVYAVSFVLASLFIAVVGVALLVCRENDSGPRQEDTRRDLPSLPRGGSRFDALEAMGWPGSARHLPSSPQLRAAKFAPASPQLLGRGASLASPRPSLPGRSRLSYDKGCHIATQVSSPPARACEPSAGKSPGPRYSVRRQSGQQATGHLCPMLVVPHGMEFVFAAQEVLTGERQQLTFGIFDLAGHPLCHVLVCESAEGPKCGLEVQFNTGEPLAFIRTQDLYQEPAGSVEICRAEGETFCYIVRERRDAATCRYVLQGTDGEHLMHFQGDFQEKAINGITPSGMLVSSSRRCTLDLPKGDTPKASRGLHYEVRVAPYADAGLQLCALLAIEKAEGGQRRR